MEILKSRRMVLNALIGEKNYNLEQSDKVKHYCYFVTSLPQQGITTQALSHRVETKLAHYEIYGVEQLNSFLIQSTIQSLEVLFSEELMFGATLSAGEGMPLLALFEAREKVANWNLPSLYERSMKLVEENLQLFKEQAEKTDVKAFAKAVECARLLDILIRYAQQGFEDFKSALWLEETSFEKSELQRIQEGTYSLTEMQDYLENKQAYVQQIIAPLYLQQSVDEDFAHWIEKQIYDLIQL